MYSIGQQKLPFFCIFGSMKRLYTEQNSPSGTRLIYCLAIPLAFIALMWIVKLVEVQEGISFARLGVYPRRLSGLAGILFSPFIHSDFNHLISNTVSLFVLSTGIFYFYKDLSYRVILFVWVVGGFMVWLGARPSYHIGASGLVYGIASFLFFSGVIRNDTRLMAISLLVVFLYGSMIWGIFPIYPKISWECHLFSSICGLVCAIIYRHQGPPRRVWSWELEPDDDEVEDGTNKNEVEEVENQNLNQPQYHNGLRPISLRLMIAKRC